MLAIGRQHLDRCFLDRHFLNRHFWLEASES
jgi:hypothetical protein